MKLDRRRAIGLVGALACTAASSPTLAAQGGKVAFLHGVASGDPLYDRLILWTRVTPEAQGDASLDTSLIDVDWEIALDADFRRIVRRGTVTTGAARDFTVKVDAVGLRANTGYFYRFRCGTETSPVGRTQTLPRGSVKDAVIALASCSLYQVGYFNAYREIARLERVDLVLHLGDYIYEYGGAPGQLGMTIGAEIGRIPTPLNEAVTLADYRERHACYRLDPDLQAAHARAPWICVWDDHESANDGWREGAQNHQAGEGDWTTRRMASVRAYYEWIPIREPQPGQPAEAINRTFELGDLATLIMLENRFMGRSRQVDLRNPKDVVWQVVDISGSEPIVLTDAALTKKILSDAARGQPVPAPYEIRVDADSIRRSIADPTRSVFGAAQEHWLEQGIASSVKAGKPWQLIGNQVVMARTVGTDIVKFMGKERWERALQTMSPQLRPWVQQLATLPRDVPFEFDGWDSYPAARARMDAIFSQSGAHPIVLSGDSHAYWINELSGAGRRRVAAEIGTTAITSSSLSNMLGDVDLGPAFTEASDEVIFCDLLTKGFTLVTLTRDEARVDLIGVSNVRSRDYKAFKLNSWRLRPESGGGFKPIEAI